MEYQFFDFIRILDNSDGLDVPREVRMYPEDNEDFVRGIVARCGFYSHFTITDIKMIIKDGDTI